MRPFKVTYGSISSIVSSKQNKCNSEVMCHLLWLGYLHTAFLSMVNLLYIFKASHCDSTYQFLFNSLVKNYFARNLNRYSLSLQH